MELERNQYDYENLTSQGTGSIGESGDYKIIIYPFGRFEIKIKLSPNNEFLEVIEVGINKDFLTQKQKINLQGFHDVEKFYIEK